LFTDWPGVLAIAAAAARDRVDELSFLRLPTLLLDMPVTSQAELSLVEALCARAPDCLITIPSADSVTLERVRSSLGTEIVNLERALGDMAITNGSLSRLQYHLFNSTSAPAAMPKDDEIVIFSAPGESRECVEIVRRVLALARQGTRFDRIAVLL